MKTWMVSLFFLFGFHSLVKAQVECIDTLSVYTDVRYVGNTIEMDVKVDKAIDILAFQFHVNFDDKLLSLIGRIDAPIPNLQVFDIGGSVRISWIDQTGCCNPLHLPDGYILMTLRFERKSLFTESYVFITHEEFAASNLDLYCVETKNTLILSSPVILKGKVIFDSDNDCILGIKDIALSNVLLEITNGTQTIYRFTDDKGDYAIGLTPGIYKIRVLPKNDLWSPCQAEWIMTLENNKTVNVNFLLQSKVDCPLLEATVATPVLQSCANNNYTLQYKNSGTEDALGVRAEIVFDKTLTFVSTDYLGAYTINSDTIIFYIDTLKVNEHGTIHIIFDLGCENIFEGQVHCVEATIYPNEPCIQDPNWDNARVKIIAECQETDGKVIFRIQNIGSDNMKDPLDYIVTEDDILRQGGNFLLEENDVLAVELEANGSTYSIRSNRPSFYPYKSNPSAALEGCGRNQNNSISKGYFTIFEYDDRDNFVDIDCQENMTKVINNTINAFPKGYGSPHYIEKNTKLEYNLVFRNTGTSNKDYVILKNEISSHLDITTLEMGAGSHPYTYRITNERQLIVTFADIALKDSIHDPMRSFGFVKYSIYPNANVPDGTVINNMANVLFDFNEEKVLESTFHTIGRDFIIEVEDVNDKEAGIDCYPNPVNETLLISTKKLYGRNIEFAMFNIDGKEVANGDLNDSITNTLDCSVLSKGSYLLVFKDEGQIVATKKLIKK
ncbi:MAG: T9SS type A sorting domain-containing protein [Saprospiraceae bacterium]